MQFEDILFGGADAGGGEFEEGTADAGNEFKFTGMD
jgi:hypothetical protein